jgi:hypothetical protein
MRQFNLKMWQFENLKMMGIIDVPGTIEFSNFQIFKSTNQQIFKSSNFQIFK